MYKNKCLSLAASGDSLRSEEDHPHQDRQPRPVRLGDPGAAAGPPGVWPCLHPLRVLHQQDPQVTSDSVAPGGDMW